MANYERALRKDVGRWIRKHRTALSLTQFAVAQRVSFTQASVSNYENGIRNIPLAAFLELVDLFDQSPLTAIMDVAVVPDA